MKNIPAKKIFIRVSRICGIFLLAAIAMLICFTILAIKLPYILGIFFTVSVAAFALCFIISVVLDIVENRKNSGYLKNYVIEIAVLSIVFILYQIYRDTQSVKYLECFADAVFIACAIHAGNYIFFGKNS